MQLRIFLSILLSVPFYLSSELHAQLQEQEIDSDTTESSAFIALSEMDTYTFQETDLLDTDFVEDTNSTDDLIQNDLKDYACECEEVGSCYNVRTETDFDTVPWTFLGPGDIVRIHYRQEPYRRIIGLRSVGTAEAPIKICGVKNIDGKLPVISGENARPISNYLYDWGDSPGSNIGDYGVVLIGKSESAGDDWLHKAEHIIVEGLKIEGAHASNTYTIPSGGERHFVYGAAGIRITNGNDITIRGCEITGNGNGIFTRGDDYGGEGTITRNTVIEGNYIHGNGNAGRETEHNIYSQGVEPIIQYNRIGRLRPQAKGTSVKDRSSGTVIRYNWIESGARTLDLVEAEDASTVVNELTYGDAFVYGNVLIDEIDENDDYASATHIVRFGADIHNDAATGMCLESGPVCRTGTLYFYNNTVVIKDYRDIAEGSYWVQDRLFELSVTDATADIRNNIFHLYAPNGYPNLALMHSHGTANLNGANWFTAGWNEHLYEDQYHPWTGTINYNVMVMEGIEPGFVNIDSLSGDLSEDDYTLTYDSQARDKGTDLAEEVVRAGYLVTSMYRIHQGGESRNVNGGALDLGAFNYCDDQNMRNQDRDSDTTETSTDTTETSTDTTETSTDTTETSTDTAETSTSVNESETDTSTFQPKDPLDTDVVEDRNSTDDLPQNDMTDYTCECDEDGSCYNVENETDFDAVPWTVLGPGDTVRIHYRQEPYRRIIGLRNVGTAQAPIKICGVKNIDGMLPVISGENARPISNYLYDWGDSPGSNIGDYGVVLIGKSASAGDDWLHKAEHIIVEGLKIEGAHASNIYTTPSGHDRHFVHGAAGIRITNGNDITIRGCEITGNGNGIFTRGDDYGGEGTITRNTVIEGNYIHGNGNVGRETEHNIYSQGVDPIIQYNRIGRLRPQAKGTSVKDRSSGTVIRYNWIESGARTLDLVEAEDASIVVNELKYGDAFVYGNVLIDEIDENDDYASATHIVHFGADNLADDATGTCLESGPVCRTGTLYFYNNTVVIKDYRDIPEGSYWVQDRLFELSVTDATADIRNNIFHLHSPNGYPNLALMRSHGTANLNGTNWFTSGWSEHLYEDQYHPWTGTINYNGVVLEGVDPGFVNIDSISGDLSEDDYALTYDSQARDKGTDLAEEVCRAGYLVTSMYRIHQGGESRDINSPATDLGAFIYRDDQLMQNHDTDSDTLETRTSINN